MAFEDARQERTALRLRLLQNGFQPIPLLHKQPFMEGWNTVEITDELIRSKPWARSRLKDTGVRCGDVIAIDWDVDDPDVLDGLIEAAHDAGLIDRDHPFVRDSVEPRELWVYRTNEPFSKRASGKFDAEGEFQVEVLGAGNQFAAFGLHTSGKAYSWPFESLLDAQYRDLPEITLEEATALVTFAAEFFESKGYERVTRKHHGEAFEKLYDLKPEMEFETRDYGRLSVQDMLDTFATDPDAKIRLALDPLVPGQTNTDRSMATAHNADSICITDFGEEQAHFLAALDLDAAIAELQGHVQRINAHRGTLPQADAADIVMDINDGFGVALSKALRRYCFWPQTNQVLDIAKLTLETSAMSMAGFRTLVGKWFYQEAAGPRGGAGAIVRLGDAWSVHEDRIDIDAVIMRPDKPFPYYEEAQETYFNTYRPQQFGEGHGSADVGIRFLSHLLPDAHERHWFMQWFKYKIENPHVPGPGIIMVADGVYGTGRGSLFRLMEAIFGQRYVKNIKFKEMTGQTSQSQYNEWQEDALMVVADEAREDRQGGRRSSYDEGVGAYEHLKDLIDPAPRRVAMVRKGRPNGQGYTCCTVVVATNHKDAVIVPASDRRLAVLTNGKPAPPEFWTEFHAWLANPLNVKTFIEWLRGTVDLSDYDPFVVPLHTVAKSRMVEAGVSDLDRVFAQAIGEMPGPIVSKMQLVHHMSRILEEHDLQVPENWEAVAGSIWKSRLNAPDTKCEAYKVQHQGKTQYPRAIDPDFIPQLEAMTRHEAREQLALNDVAPRKFQIVPGGRED